MPRIFVCLLAFPFLLQAQEREFNFKNAADYNNFIMKEMASTVQKNFEYIAFTVHSEEYDQLEAKRKEVVDAIVVAKEHVRTLPALEGDTRLRDESVEVLNEYQKAFELDYKNVIGLKRKSRDSYETMASYFEAQDKAEEKVNKATQQLRKAQHAYAEKHNMKMGGHKSDDELEAKMNKVVAVNNYWRSIFLEYFRISRQYDRMWDVLAEQKAANIDRERLQTLKVIDQVLPQLRSRPDFNGDAEFRDQTVNMIEYFRSAAANDFLRIVEILTKKQLEQKDVNEVNAIINKCNSDHEQLSYNWNIASQDLLKRNVDKE